MTNHPLYLPTTLIPAFVAGRVTMLIEPLKVQPPEGFVSCAWDAELRMWAWLGEGPAWDGWRFAVPRYAPGHRLWLREAWVQIQGENGPQDGRCLYRADARDNSGRKWLSVVPGDPDGEVDWTPSIAMPKWASRAWAEVVSVDVKWVQDVTEGEAFAAGCESDYCVMCDGFVKAEGGCCYRPTPANRQQFLELWEATHGPAAWDRNPLCTFTTIKPHAGNMEGE